MRIISAVVFFLAVASVCTAQPFRFMDDPKSGTLTLLDGERPVLTYCYGDQLKEGVDPKYTQSCYIHPLYDLDGQALTDDSPVDHRHHHGMFWTWPRIKTRGKSVQTWAPSTPPLRQRFVKWLRQEAGAEAATLSVQNEWMLQDERVAIETGTLVVHRANEVRRPIDVTLTFEAVGGPMELLGADKKGYGGLCLRLAPPFKGATMTTDTGVLTKDSMNVAYRWADLSAAGRGVAVFVQSDHPNYPPTWFIRNSYAGILNVSWPGVQPATLNPGEPVTLRYRLYIHRGDAKDGRVAEAFEEFFNK